MRSPTLCTLALFGMLGAGCIDLAPKAPLTEIELNPNGELILTGDTLTMIPSVYDADGIQSLIPPWVPIHWSSSDESLEILDGRIVGFQGSDAKITAYAAGLTGGARIRINPRELDVTVTVILNQASQNLQGTVPLIAGRDAILRVFVTSNEVNFYESVDVQARFIHHGGIWKTPILTTKSDSIETELIDDFYKSYFYNVAIPGEFIRPGTLVEIELDPEDKLPLSLSLQPNPASFQLPVVKVPVHRQIVVPTIASGGGSDTDILQWTEGLTNESRHFAMMRTAMPVHEMEVELHEVFHTTADLRTYEGWIQWINEVDVLRIAEGRTGWYYYAVFSHTYRSGIGGVALWEGHSAAGITSDWTIAHELGHNFGLLHAPCAAPHVDPNFPYSFGRIGQWGFDIGNEQVYDPRFTLDLMGYCSGPRWISDYHFNKALEWRLEVANSQPPRARQPTTLIWGRINDEGVELHPAFALNTIPEVPSGVGDHTLTVLGSDNEILYRSRFEPKLVSIGGGERQFHFAIPHDGESEISRIVVIGPEGRDEIGRGTEIPMAMIWDGDQVIAMRRGWDMTPAAMTGPDGARRIIISEGVPR